MAWWEQGSDFHWVDLVGAQSAASLPWSGGKLLLGSGRDAIRALIAFGMRSRGWRRFWVPSYFCQEVVASIASTGIPVAVYPDSPLEPSPPEPEELAAGDVFLIVNYFGLRHQTHAVVPAGVDLVEDHTHDPWSPWALASDAHFCVASLRKCLPLPDGGVLWSPRGLQLPPPHEATPSHLAAAHHKLSAMLLKRAFLESQAVPKDAYRELNRLGEAQLCGGQASGMSPLSIAVLNLMPVVRWQEVRRANHSHLAQRLSGEPWVRVLRPSSDVGSPFSVIAVFDTPGRRESVRQRLIAQHVYPAVLWPPEGHSPCTMRARDRDLSARLLSVHCDMRYSSADMDRVAEIVIALGRSWG